MSNEAGNPFNVGDDVTILGAAAGNEHGVVLAVEDKYCWVKKRWPDPTTYDWSRLAIRPEAPPVEGETWHWENSEPILILEVTDRYVIWEMIPLWPSARYLHANFIEHFMRNATRKKDT